MATSTIPARASDAGPETKKQDVPDYLDLIFDAEDELSMARKVESDPLWPRRPYPGLTREEKRRMHLETAIEKLRAALEIC